MSGVIKSDNDIPKLIGIYFSEKYKRFGKGELINLSNDYYIYKKKHGNDFLDYEFTVEGQKLYLYQNTIDTFGDILSRTIVGYEKTISVKSFVGDNGSGKSTLLDIIELFYKEMTHDVLGTIRPKNKKVGYIYGLLDGIIFIVEHKNTKSSNKRAVLNLTRTERFSSPKKEFRSLIAENFPVLADIIVNNLNIASSLDNVKPVISLKFNTTRLYRVNNIEKFFIITILLDKLITSDSLVNVDFGNSDKYGVFVTYFLGIYNYFINLKKNKNHIILFFLMQHAMIFDGIFTRNIPLSDEDLYFLENTIQLSEKIYDFVKNIKFDIPESKNKRYIIGFVEKLKHNPFSNLHINKELSKNRNEENIINISGKFKPDFVFPFGVNGLIKSFLNDNEYSNKLYEYKITINLNDFLLGLKRLLPNSDEQLLIKKIMKSDLFSFDVRIESNEGVFFLEGLSSGEKQMMLLFSRLKNAISSYYDNPKETEKSKILPHLIILIDEPETSLHLERQRKFVYLFMKNLSYFINCYNVDNVSLFIATHSPFIISDIHKDNIVFLKRATDKNNSFTEVKSWNDLSNGADLLIDNTFLGNISELIRGAFFLSKPYGELGETFIKKLSETKDIELEEVKKICGDDYLMEYLFIKYQSKIDDNSENSN